MAIVLGIDAAWTAARPSGVALVRGRGRSWRCLAAAGSYAELGVTSHDELLARCVALAGAPPDVIAIDMPLAETPITARRAADNAISSAYGAFGLGAHSPSAERPGLVADAMRAAFAVHGYRVATAATPPGTPRVLIEVFPHAAAIALAGARYRVPYKIGRSAQYWPERSLLERRAALLREWGRLERALALTIAGARVRPPRTGTLAALKRYEDMLDAVICAWTGIEYLARRARPFGDAASAVWAPDPPVR